MDQEKIENLYIRELQPKEYHNLNEFPNCDITIYPNEKEMTEKINEIIYKFNYLLEVITNGK